MEGIPREQAPALQVRVTSGTGMPVPYMGGIGNFAQFFDRLKQKGEILSDFAFFLPLYYHKMTKKSSLVLFPALV